MLKDKEHFHAAAMLPVTRTNCPPNNVINPISTVHCCTPFHDRQLRSAVSFISHDLVRLAQFYDVAMAYSDLIFVPSFVKIS